MTGCREALRRLWEYLDGNLDDADRAAVEEHLSRCRRCCGELAFAQELRGFLATVRRETIPPGALHRLDQALKELER